MKQTHSHRVAGVTMIELLIVLAIVAILAAVAINSYRQYILRGNRTYATSALQDLASREENYYFSNSAYTQSMNSLGAATSAPVNGTPYYTVNVVSASSSDYTVEAQAVGTQTQDTACQTFTLTRIGTSSPTSCWQNSQ